jgi:hypothetical protein
MPYAPVGGSPSLSYPFLSTLLQSPQFIKKNYASPRVRSATPPHRPSSQGTGPSLAGPRLGACAIGHCQAMPPSSAVGWVEPAAPDPALHRPKEQVKNTCCRHMF